VSIDNQQADTWARMADTFPGATVVPFRDNLSAWDPEAVRPEWDALLDGIRAGRFAAVGAWAPDRFTRQPAQAEALWAACQASGTELWTAHAGHVTSMLMLRIQMAIAADESDTKSRRLKMKHQGKADRGQFHGGKRRFGYTADMTAVVEHEAAVIREAAAAVLAGSTLASVARDLDARGVATALGGKWTGSNLSTMLRRPHLAGLRVHGKAPNQTTTTATWDPILDRSTWERLQLLLGKPERRTSHSNARVYLLAGWATCAACGSPLRGRPGTKANPDRRAYACATGRHFYRATEDVDAVVETRLVRRLSRMSAAGAIVLDDQGQDQVEALAAERDALVARLGEYADAASTMSVAAYAAATAALEAEVAAVDQRMVEADANQARPLAVLDGMTGAGAAEAWAAASLGRKRAILDVLCQVSVVGGAATGRRTFEPEDVVVLWKIPQAR
jgi:DNA invertase Pin-like site-specific DNA recombinase